jgi:hypothetical protein
MTTWNADGSQDLEVARFVIAGDIFVQTILSRAVDQLVTVTRGQHRSFASAATGGCVHSAAEAIYLHIKQERFLRYEIEAQFDPVTTAQNIRLPPVIQQVQIGTCIDLVLLFLSCLVSADLRPAYVHLRGKGAHALAGVWLTAPDADCPFHLTIEQCKRQVALERLLLVECTGFAEGAPPRDRKLPFADACTDARVTIERHGGPGFALDIRRAWREGGVSPLQPTPQPDRPVVVVLVVHGNLGTFSIDALLGKLHEVLPGSSAIQVLETVAGSVKVTLRMTALQAAVLLELIKAQMLTDFTVLEAYLVDESVQWADVPAVLAKANTPPPLKTDDDLASYLLSALLESAPVAHMRAFVSAFVDSLKPYLLPSVAGGSAEVDLSQPSSLVATKLLADGIASWWRGDATRSATGLVVSQLSTGPELATEPHSVWLDNGRVCIDRTAFPADDRWHLFCVAPEPADRLLRLPRSRCELFYLRKPAAPVGAEPFALLVGGFLLEAWIAAIAVGWGPTRLRPLVHLIYSASIAMLRNELVVTTSPDAGAVELRDPALGQWLGDMHKDIVRRLQIQQQALIEAFRRP